MHVRQFISGPKCAVESDVQNIFVQMNMGGVIKMQYAVQKKRHSRRMHNRTPSTKTLFKNEPSPPNAFIGSPEFLGPA
jgi:hypothetical protein